MKLRRVEVTNWRTGKTKEAFFHQFGLELEGSVGERSSSYTVAIVEYLDRSVDTVAPQDIRFLDSPEALA